MRARLLIVIPATLAFAGCCGGTASQARKTAAEGRLDEAIASLEAAVAEEPDPEAYYVLGDLRFTAARAAWDELSSVPEDAVSAEDTRSYQENLEGAAVAWARAANEGHELGMALSKVAVARKLQGSYQDADDIARKAWECCQEPAAWFGMSDEETAVNALQSQPPAKLGEWRTLPLFAASASWTRTTLLVGPAGAKGEVTRGDSPAVDLPAFHRATVESWDEGPVIEDRLNPVRDTKKGYVDDGLCPRTGGQRCGGGRWTRNTGRYVSNDKIMNGPCWLICRRGEHARSVSMRGVDENSVRCVAGTYYSRGAGSCRVKYDVVRYERRRLAETDVWLLPAGEVDASSRMKLAHDAGLEPIRDALVEGKLTTGLPAPLLPSAVVGADSAFTVDEAGIQLVSDTPFLGRMVLENGLLTEWNPPDLAGPLAAAPGDYDPTTAEYAGAIIGSLQYCSEPTRKGECWNALPEMFAPRKPECRGLFKVTDTSAYLDTDTCDDGAFVEFTSEEGSWVPRSVEIEYMGH